MTTEQRLAKGYYRRSEVAKMIGVSRQLLDLHWRGGSIPQGVEIDGDVLFTSPMVEKIRTHFLNRKKWSR